MFRVQLLLHVLCTCIKIFLPYVKQEKEVLYVTYGTDIAENEELGK